MARDDAKPIRSLLYTPGDQEQRIADNAASGADALFLDLEEPRTPCTEETRVRARKLVREFLDTAPTALSNLQLAYNSKSGTLDTRDNSSSAGGPTGALCNLLAIVQPGSAAACRNSLGLPALHGR